MISPKNDMTMMDDHHQAPLAAVAMPSRRRSVSSVVSMTSTSSATNSPAGSKAGQRRKSTSLPSETVEYLKNWMMSPEHIAHPYPTEREKAEIMADTGIELKQLTNWFVNNRKRFWKPRVEARVQVNHQPVTTTASTTVMATTTAAAAAALVAASPSRTTTTARSPMTPQSTKPLTHVISSPSVMTLVEKAMMNMSSSPVSDVTTQVPMVRGVSPMSIPTPNCFSEQSSSSFDSGDDSVTSSSMEGGAGRHHDEQAGSCFATAPTMPLSLTLRSEKVDIHVLQPSSAGQEEPTVQDVVVVSMGNVLPHDRIILATFQGCDVTYKVPDFANGREAELVRMKEQCLETFLSQVVPRRGTVATKAAGSMKRARSQEVEEEDVDEPYGMVSTARPRFRRKSIQVWKKACQEADHGAFYSASLPSLEEATKLFGYAQD